MNYIYKRLFIIPVFKSDGKIILTKLARYNIVATNGVVALYL